MEYYNSSVAGPALPAFRWMHHVRDHSPGGRGLHRTGVGEGQDQRGGESGTLNTAGATYPSRYGGGSTLGADAERVQNRAPTGGVPTACFPFPDAALLPR
jgi:hypothetical protein